MENGARMLRTLNRFLDVLFALAFFRTIEFLPMPQSTQLTTLPYGILSVMGSSPANLTRVVFCLIIIVYYWSRKNTLLGVVQAANGAFALLSVASLAALFVFLYALAADPTYVGGWPTLLLQSGSLFVASLLGYLALRYAIRAGLVPSNLKAPAERIARVDLSNPLTALIATALSWSGLTIWTLSWFVLMPVLGFLLGKTANRHAHAGRSQP
jgi:hypothetical protein